MGKYRSHKDKPETPHQRKKRWAKEEGLYDDAVRDRAKENGEFLAEAEPTPLLERALNRKTKTRPIGR